MRFMGSFLYFIVQTLLELLVWAIIISAVLSWLVAFDVINLRNRFVYSVSRFLEAVTRPVLRPVQRIIPSLGGVDISPIIVILVLQGVIRYLLPMIFSPLVGLMG
jgi:YggT family protein